MIYRDSLSVFTAIRRMLVWSKVRLFQISHRQRPISALVGIANSVMIDIVEIKYSGGRCHRVAFRRPNPAAAQLNLRYGFDPLAAVDLITKIVYFINQNTLKFNQGGKPMATMVVSIAFMILSFNL